MKGPGRQGSRLRKATVQCEDAAGRGVRHCSVDQRSADGLLSHSSSLYGIVTVQLANAGTQKDSDTQVVVWQQVEKMSPAEPLLLTGRGDADEVKLDDTPLTSIVIRPVFPAEQEVLIDLVAATRE